jgi:hypothetical protein
MDSWKIRSQRLDALFLAAAKEALPQEAVSSVSIAYHYVDQTQDELEIQPGCVRVEIVRPRNGLLNRSFFDARKDGSELSAGELRLAGAPVDQSADR